MDIWITFRIATSNKWRIFAIQIKRKENTMKFKFTDENGNDYQVEVRARDNRNLNASKKATQTVMTEIANLIGCAAYHYKLVDCNKLKQYAQTNANNIINVVL